MASKKPFDHGLSPEDDAFHRQVVENLSDGLYVLAPDRRITYWNGAAERITGYAAERVVGRYCQANILAHVDDAGKSLCSTHCPLSETMRDGQPREQIVYLRHADGHRLPVRTRTSPIRDGAGEIVGGLEVFDDASSLLSARDEAHELREQALTDALTGLPNRRQAETFLAGRLDSFERRGWPVGLLILDVDGFKAFNDRHGHEVGDAALRVIAATLRSVVRGEDLPARWGGDEFTVIVTNPGAPALALAAERIRRLVARSRVRVAGLDLPIAVSVGGTVVRPGDDAADLFARADSALYLAKRAGRNQVAFVAVDEPSPERPTAEPWPERSPRNPT